MTSAQQHVPKTYQIFPQTFGIICFLIIPSNFGWNMSAVKLQGLKSAGTLHEVKLVINAREDFSNSLGGGFKIDLYIYIYIYMFLSQSILQSTDTFRYKKCQANLDSTTILSMLNIVVLSILKLLNLGSKTTKIIQEYMDTTDMDQSMAWINQWLFRVLE